MRYLPNLNQILIEPEEKENKTASGVLLTEEGKEKPTRGRIVEIGHLDGRYTKGFHQDAPIASLHGATVVFKQWAGHEVDKYLVVDVVDILCVVEGGDSDEKASQEVSQ